MNALREFICRVRANGKRRSGVVQTTSMGRVRTFEAYDLGADTFIFECGIARHLNERPSVIIACKNALRRRASGHVMTLTGGNHSVAAFPLLDGRFWHLSNVPPARRSEVLTHDLLCANGVDGVLELSQREIATEKIVALDTWLLRGAGFTLGGVVMMERNTETLDYYRRLGQEWRVKPLAWTANEMRVALASSRKSISTDLQYYHSAHGVHLMSFAEFKRLATWAKTSPAKFVAGLRELVSVFEGNRLSFTRMPKHRGHHEIELFGLPRGIALERIIPALERLMEAIALGQIGQLGILQKIDEIASDYEALLARPELANEDSTVFVETIYMYVTGEIYAVVGEGSTPAFDDRRTALPGATFVNGRLDLHPGADARTEVLLANLRGQMSKDEIVEYANVYELRTKDEELPLGRGSTREVVYKTNLRPLAYSLVEKRLSRASAGYSQYMLARIGALRALGLGLSERYLLLKHRPGSGNRSYDYYIRSRCEGEPLEGISAGAFRSSTDAALEDREVVLGLAGLMGDAAAQNLAMKKYDPRTETPLFGVGKEIYEFGYDLVQERVLPKRVTTCSIRGSFGWPSTEFTEANLNHLTNFYMGHFAHALKAYQRQHAAVSMREMAERFMNGFTFRLHALAWHVSVMRDQFEAFAPKIPPRYGFAQRWRFVLWAVEEHERHLPALRRMFLSKVRVIENENIRNNPQ